MSGKQRPRKGRLKKEDLKNENLENLDMESDDLETEDLVDHTAVYRYTSFLDDRWLRICMSTASTEFPSYASQVACQVSQASQGVSQGSNMRKCIKNIYNGEKACLSPFSTQELTKK